MLRYPVLFRRLSVIVDSNTTGTVGDLFTNQTIHTKSESRTSLNSWYFHHTGEDLLQASANKLTFLNKKMHGRIKQGANENRKIINKDTRTIFSTVTGQTLTVVGLNKIHSTRIFGHFAKYGAIRVPKLN